MQTYLFYDIETTGLNKAFDQVLQFAAIRTDLELNELERYELNIKLNPDCIPSPGAIITHQIGIVESLTGITELEAMLQIHSWLNTPGTISIGYNTLGFDDEFLRFSFYRNLLTPYTHQYANQCSRMDLYPIAVLFYLYKNTLIKWPMVNDQPSLKLESINQANGFVAGRSHHAMVDVEVTLALAKCFYRDKKMWDYVLGYFNKQTDKSRFQANNLEENILLDGKYGAAQFYQLPVLFLGEHKHYKNQTLWLRLDTENLTATTNTSIAENTWAVRKKWGEPGFILPPKERFHALLTPPRQEQINSNKAWLKNHPDMLAAITEYHLDYTYPVIPETDVEASLYMQGFWSAEDQLFCRRFHQATPENKALMTTHCANSTLKALATRLLGRHYPEYLDSSQKK